MKSITAKEDVIQSLRQPRTLRIVKPGRKPVSGLEASRVAAKELNLKPQKVTRK